MSQPKAVEILLRLRSKMIDDGFQDISDEIEAIDSALYELGHDEEAARDA